MTLRGETPSASAEQATWRPVTDDCRVRHVAGPAALDTARQRHPVNIALVLEGTCYLRRAGTVTPLPRATLVIDLVEGTIEVPEGARLGLATFLSLAEGPGLLEASPGLRQITSVDPSLARVTETTLAWVLHEPPTGPFAKHLIQRTIRDLIGGLILDGRLRPPKTPEHSLYSAVLHHVVDHYRDADLGPESIAAAFNVSVRHLARAFHDNGTTVGRAIARTRVSVASALLTQQPDLSLDELTVASGFSSQQAMRRAFRATGMVSPSHIRTLSARRHQAANRSGSRAP